MRGRAERRTITWEKLKWMPLPREVLQQKQLPREELEQALKAPRLNVLWSGLWMHLDWSGFMTGLWGLPDWSGLLSGVHSRARSSLEGSWAGVGSWVGFEGSRTEAGPGGTLRQPMHAEQPWDKRQRWPSWLWQQWNQAALWWPLRPPELGPPGPPYLGPTESGPPGPPDLGPLEPGPPAPLELVGLRKSFSSAYKNEVTLTRWSPLQLLQCSRPTGGRWGGLISPPSPRRGHRRTRHLAVCE